MATTTDEGLPRVSIVIPTLNSGGTMEECLQSIEYQNYPKGKIETIIVDGGSTDSTRLIAEKYHCLFLNNHLVSHLRGRAIGIRASTGSLVACIDSDNVLDSRMWLREMVRPFLERDIVATEPLFFSSRHQDSMLTKYISLVGGDDPVAIYMGFHDRYSLIKGTWTGSSAATEDRGNYLKITFLDPKHSPPIGANGFVVRRDILDSVCFDPFLHVKVFRAILVRTHGKLGKVKVGIIHVHAGDLRTFMAKKLRRIRRRISIGPVIPSEFRPVAILILAISLAFGRPFVDALLGFARRPSTVWFLHPILTYGTALAYFLALFSNTTRTHGRGGR